MKKLNVVDWIAMVFLIVGGINWGLIGFFGVDVISAIFGDASGVTRFVYALVGLSAIYLAVMPTVFGREECIPGEPIAGMR